MVDTNESGDERVPQLPTEEVLTRITDAVYALNRDWEFTYVNPKAEELLDRSAEELIATNAWEAFPDAVGTTFEEQYRRAMETQSAVSFEEYYPPLDTWFEVRVYPSETGLSVFFNSVSEERRRARDLEKYETIVETVEDGIFAMDETGTFLEVNEAYTRLTGYSHEELVGETPSFLVDDETIQEFEHIFEELFSRERDSATIAADITTADGDRVPTETTLSPFSFERETGIIGVVRDVSSRKRYRQRLKSLHEATRDVMEAETKEEVGEIVLATTEEILDLPVLAIYFWDEGEGCLTPGLSSRDTEELFDGLPTLTGGESLAWDAFIENEVRVYDDVRAEEGCFDPETVIRSELFAPLGEHGLLVSGSTEPGFHESTHVDLISILAANAAVAFDRVERQARLTDRQEELREQTRRLEKLVRTNNVVRDSQRALVNAATRREATESICENLVSVDPYCFAWVGDAGQSGGVRPEAWSGRNGEFLDHLNESDDADEGPTSPAERAVESGEPVITNSIFREESFPKWRKEALQRGFQSAISLPLASNGTVHGVIEIYASEADAFEDGQEEVFFELSEIAADGIEMIERRQVTTSANDVEVELDSTAGESFLGKAAREADAELHVDSATLRDDGTWLLYLTTGDSDVEDVRSTFDESTIVEKAKRIRTNSDEELFGVIVTEFDVGRILTEYGATLTRLSVSTDALELELRIAKNVNVRGLVDAYRNVFPDADLVRREPVTDETDDASPQSPPDSLTDRQREVLRTAYNEGFFEWPRETSGEDIADMLGISNPVFHRHVRRALQKHVSSRFED